MRRTICVIAMIAFAFGALLLGNFYFDKYGIDESKKDTSNILADSMCDIDYEYLSAHNMKDFTSNLPVIMIDTEGETIVKEIETPGTCAVIDNDNGKNNIEDDYSALLYCGIKQRGASSYTGFDKEQYRLKFYKKKDGKKYEYSLCGLGLGSEWVLNGPFLDKTAVRNALTYKMAQGTNVWSPDTAYAEVFVNGEYKGLYVVTEPVSQGETGINISDFGMSSGQTAYIVSRDRTGTETNPLSTWGNENGKTLNELNVKYPSTKNLTLRSKIWIEEDISRFEKVLYSDYFDDKDIGYAKYIDVDSFVDYYIINEIVLNHDAGAISTYAYKELNGKLKMALWDYNNAFDNYQWFSMEVDKFHLKDEMPWFNRLVQDRNFVDKICTRYKELRKGNFNEKTMYAYIDKQELYISKAMERNYKIWGYSLKMNLLVNEDENDRNVYSVSSAIKQLKKVIRGRYEFLDRHIEDLYDNCLN